MGCSVQGLALPLHEGGRALVVTGLMRVGAQGTPARPLAT